MRIYELKNGIKVVIKLIKKEDYEYNDNFAHLYSWRKQVDKYLTRTINPKDVERDRKKYYAYLDTPEHIILGAFSQAYKIIGVCTLHIDLEHNKLCHRGHFGIMIHPKYQSNGLGTRLLQCIEQCAIKRGLLRLEAAYFSKNIHARNLYQKLGYQIEGKKQMALKQPDGSFDDEIIIGKILDKEHRQVHEDELRSCIY